MKKWPLETAEQLRAARAMAGIAREELAKMAGLSEATVKHLERLKGKLSASTATIASPKSRA